MMWNKPLLP